MECNKINTNSNGGVKWIPKAQPQKILNEETEPDPCDSSDSYSDCGSINNEDVCVKSICTVNQECVTIKRNYIYIQKNLRAEKAFKILKNVITYIIFKNRVRFLMYRSMRLDEIYFKIQASKIIKFFREFIERKKLITAEILEKYKWHCAIYIQKVFRGFALRKKISLSKLKESILKVNWVIIGWKVRIIMRNPNIIILTNKIKSSPSSALVEEFINAYHLLYNGNWASKSFKLPQHRRILYKNHTMKLKINH